MSRPKIEFWSGIEEDIVRTSGNRAEAYRQLRLEGFKRTENATWAKYRKLKRKHMIKTDEDDEFDRIERQIKSSGMDCCTYDCIQGRDCPIRKATLEEVAKEFDAMKSLGDTAASFAAFVRGMKLEK